MHAQGIVVVHYCNLSVWEAEAGGLIVWGQPSCIVNPRPAWTKQRELDHQTGKLNWAGGGAQCLVKRVQGSRFHTSTMAGWWWGHKKQSIDKNVTL